MNFAPKLVLSLRKPKRRVPRLAEVIQFVLTASTPIPAPPPVSQKIITVSGDNEVTMAGDQTVYI